MSKIYDFIEHLRGSEEHIKRRWLFVFSGISMAVIVFLWMAYFNSLVQPLGAPQEAQQAEQDGKQSFGFWETFKTGLGAVIGSSGKSVDYLMNKLRQPKNYDITPQ